MFFPKSSQRRHILATCLFVALSSAHLTFGQPHSWAENVCNESIPIKKDLIVERPVQYEIKVQSMCGILPCVRTRLETRMDQTIKTVVEQVNRLTCCPGFVETLNRRCAPVCSDPCGPGGKCVEPNVCKCHPEPSAASPGFTGPTCRRFACLASDRWGGSCERQCQSDCSNTNSYCSADTGKCSCNPGWHGPNCDLECGPEDALNSGCSFMSHTPPIVEPDANLVMSNSVLSRTQKAEALILDNDDDVKIISKDNSFDGSRAWASQEASYMIGLLSLLSVLLLVAFLIVKKRYDFVRNQLYQASVTPLGSRCGGSGPGSDYSTSTYYSAGRTPASIGGEKNFGSNLSFAAATRNILAGPFTSDADPKKKMLFSPRTESHLITSQEKSQQNIYSEIDLVKESIANRARAQTPTIARRQMDKVPDDADDEDHIYQVPKKFSPLKGANETSVSTDSAQPLRPGDVSVDLGDDDSNIYEEIKPRNGGGADH